MEYLLLTECDHTAMELEINKIIAKINPLGK